MNDAMTAAPDTENGTDAQDFVELGDVSTETKGGFAGSFFDGFGGFFNL